LISKEREKERGRTRKSLRERATGRKRDRKGEREGKRERERRASKRNSKRQRDIKKYSSRVNKRETHTVADIVVGNFFEGTSRAAVAPASSLD